MINRRKFLKVGGGYLGAATGFASNLASFNTYAADTSGYKALVCVFLRGGMDGHDVVIPYDISSSLAYETIRAPIIDNYSAAGNESRRRSNLLSLQGTGDSEANGSLADGREFAVAKEYSALHDLYLEGKMAVVGNVGPLIEPTTRTTYNNGAAALPPRLFSHNDQQSIWMASSPEGATEGWGGRFGDVTSSANLTSSFTAVSTAGNQVFTNGLNVNTFNLSTSGGLNINSLNSGSFLGSDAFADAYQHNVYGNINDHSNLLRKDMLNLTGQSVDDNIMVSEALASAVGLTTEFPDSSLGQQLSIVARMIAIRDILGMRRQIFFVSDNGYDTHSDQATGLPVRQRIISEAMAAFYNETVAMGVENDVTSFTASDFGRSLVPNTSGTDHGWGSHHFVLGGAVNGGRIFGNIPEAAINHEQDVGRGRLIPELSVDQYACALGRFYGLTIAECLNLLPNLSNFNARSLYGLFFDDYL